MKPIKWLNSAFIRVPRQYAVSVQDSFDLNPRHPKIDQQTNLQTRCFKIVHALRKMDIINRLDCFQLDQHAPLYQQIDDIIANNHPVVLHADANLLLHYQTGFTHLMGQSVFIHLLQEAATERICYGIGAANDLFGDQFIHFENPIVTTDEHR